LLTQAQTRRTMWGEELNSIDDIITVFVKYLRGEIPKLPWYTNSFI
jgi:DNA-binding response OmpR family regulator